jgi:hypothetical protein
MKIGAQVEIVSVDLSVVVADRRPVRKIDILNLCAANHTSGNKNNQQFPPLTSKIPIQAVMEVVLACRRGKGRSCTVRDIA